MGIHDGGGWRMEEERKKKFRQGKGREMDTHTGKPAFKSEKNDKLTEIIQIYISLTGL